LNKFSVKRFSRLRNLCFVEDNHKELSNEQMARELNVSTKCIIKYKRMLGIQTPLGNSRGFKSETMCWDCKLATSDSCVWVRTLKIKPEGCELKKNGDIISCPQFIRG